MENVKIRDWYMAAYPTDNLGPSIDPEATFIGLFETLDGYQDVYRYLGEGDSIIRERCFSKLAEIMDVDYNYIYEQWLRAA